MSHGDYREFSSVPKPASGMSEMAKALQSQVPAADRRDANGKAITSLQPMSAEAFKAINDGSLHIGIDTAVDVSRILSFGTNR